MELKLLSFDQMERMAKCYKDVPVEPLIVALPSIFSKAPFDQIPYKVISKSSGWDGENGTLVFPDDNVNVMTILHEISHYLLCPPERLKDNNFGLGWGDSSGLLFGNAPVTAKGNEAEKEEEAVCDLTIALAKKLRVPIPAIMDEMYYANISGFILNSPDQARDCAKESLALIKNRNIERFGFKVVYPG